MIKNTNNPMRRVSLIRRLACCLYESLTLVAIWLLSAAIFSWVSGTLDDQTARRLLQAMLWLVTGGYFMVCWLRSGQTLAMQAWKMKLVNQNGGLLTVKQAAGRYLLLTLSFSVFCLGFFWALIDKEHQFLHDRILHTRLINT